MTSEPDPAASPAPEIMRPSREERAVEVAALRAADDVRKRIRARDALNRARREEAAGRLDEAARWLERAHRLARADHAVAFALAMLRLRTGDPAGAVLLLLPIARRFDLPQAWIAIAVARRAQRLVAEAAHMLEEVLSRHVLDRSDPSTFVIATGIARECGAAGWCAIDADGSLTIRLIDPAVRLEVAVDGQAIPPLAIGGHGVERHVAAGPALSRAARAEIAASLHGVPCRLLACRLDLAARRQLDGCVLGDGAGGIVGWAWHPRQPLRLPAIEALDAAGLSVATLAPFAETGIDIPERPLGMSPFGFALPASALPAGRIRIVDAEGRDLPGSPIDPGLEDRAMQGLAAARPASAGGASAPAPAGGAFVPIAARFVAPPPAAPARTARRRRVAIVVPAYRDLARTLDCLDSLEATVPSETEIHVVDDATPEPALAAALLARAEAGRIVLHRWSDGRNRGFPASANAGIDAAAGQDVVLLNADTRVAGDWLARLRRAAYADPATGSATPLTNEGSIFGYPKPRHPNDMPDAAGLARLAEAAARANDGVTVEVPTGNGFCMFIRRDCLDDVGAFRRDLFAQGYGEENDFCLRARHRGWRHVAALDVYVAHAGGASFRAGKLQLVARNLALLNRLHPGYDALIAAFIAADPLAAPRRRLDLALLSARPAEPSVIVVTHQFGGGVERAIRSRLRAIRAEGLRPILLRGDDGDRDDVVLVEEGGAASRTPNLRYALPDDRAALVSLLAGLSAVRVEIHHLLGHHESVADLCRSLGLPVEVRVHDHAWFCQRITLLGPASRYCGEPPVSGCRACIAELGNLIGPDPGAEGGIDAHLARASSLLRAASRIVAPSADAAARLQAHFPGIAVAVEPWDPEPPRVPTRRPPGPVGAGRPLTVCVLGAIGPEKGIEVLIACVRDAAARRLPIRYVVVGHTSEDDRLMAAGPVFVTGAYEEDEAVGLIRASGADLAFLPSIWPETWCYALTECWRAGLEAAAFDIGAQAERIAARGDGLLLPLDLPAVAINDAFLQRFGADAQAPPAGATVEGGFPFRPPA